MMSYGVASFAGLHAQCEAGTRPSTLALRAAASGAHCAARRIVFHVLFALSMTACVRSLGPQPPAPPPPSLPQQAAPPPPSPRARVVVPDLSDRTTAEASQVLTTLGLRFRLVLFDTIVEAGSVAARSLRPGIVYGQNPAGGTQSEVGGIVELRVLASLTVQAREQPVAPPDSAYVAPVIRPTNHTYGTDASASGRDTDRDGIPDDEDACPNTPSAAPVITRGCSIEQRDAFVASLPDGTYAFNALRTMIIERDYVIVLVLKPRTRTDLSASDEQMRGAVLAALEEAAATPTDSMRIEVRQRPFASRMRAQLQVPDPWRIRARAGFPEEQFISERDSTVWIWEVTPIGCSHRTFLPTLVCGDETLSLAVNAFFGDHIIPWPLIQERIHVRVTLGQKLVGVASASFPWIGLLLLPAIGTAWWSRRRRITILFLAANPHDTSRLNLDEEIRAIDAALQKAPHRKRFRVEQHWAVRSTELDDFLLRHRPQIVHFSGHGSPGSELFLEGAENRDVRRATGPRTSERVSAASLSRLFAPLKGTVRCVVLNACYSDAQARAIAEHVDCVVGMSSAIGDAAAISFASALYQALAYGEDVDKAFQLACSEIDRARLRDEDVPRLIGRGSGLAFVRKRS